MYISLAIIYWLVAIVIEKITQWFFNNLFFLNKKQPFRDTLSGADCFVAEIDGKIVGSVALFLPKTDAYKGLVDELDHPEIRMLAVSKMARSKGERRR